MERKSKVSFLPMPPPEFNVSTGRKWDKLEDVSDLIEAIYRNAGRVAFSLKELGISAQEFFEVTKARTRGTKQVQDALIEARASAVAYKMDQMDKYICDIAADEAVDPDIRLRAAVSIIRLYTPKNVPAQNYLDSQSAESSEWDEAEADRHLERLEPRDVH